MDKQQLIHDIREAHERTARALAGIPDARLLEPAAGEWTGKDLVSHLASWHDHSARVVASLRAGDRPYDRLDPANSTDAMNERTYREHIDDSPETVRGWFGTSFERLLAALEPCTAEELFASERWPWLDGEALVEAILWDTSRHYDEHGSDLGRLTS